MHKFQTHLANIFLYTNIWNVALQIDSRINHVRHRNKYRYKGTAALCSIKPL